MVILELALMGAAALTGPTHCQRAVIEPNSNTGTPIHVLICDALKPSDGEGWQLIVDGSPLRNGAVIFGFINP